MHTSTPLIPFNLVVDTDLGLIKMINKKYHDKNTFHTGLLSAPIKQLVYLLYTRKHYNPLSVIMRDTTDTVAMDDFYNEFMEKEYVSILENSVTTDVHNAIRLFNQSEGIIRTTILCKNQKEEDVIKKLDIGSDVDVVIGDYRDANISVYDPIYFKNFRDAIPVADRIAGKNIYIANYEFNYTYTPEESRVLLPDVSILLLDQNLAKVTDIYKIDESYIAKG